MKIYFCEEKISVVEIFLIFRTLDNLFYTLQSKEWAFNIDCRNIYKYDIIYCLCKEGKE